jgi:hypothetical protein
VFEGVEIFFALKRKLDLAKPHIVDMKWFTQFKFSGRLWRIMGTGVPRLLYAGYFRGRGRRYFLYLSSPQGWAWKHGSLQARNVLVITTQNYRYQEIILTCPAKTGKELVEWFKDR